jgi:hypothetical protein
MLIFSGILLSSSIHGVTCSICARCQSKANRIRWIKSNFSIMGPSKQEDLRLDVPELSQNAKWTVKSANVTIL